MIWAVSIVVLLPVVFISAMVLGGVAEVTSLYPSPSEEVLTAAGSAALPAGLLGGIGSLVIIAAACRLGWLALHYLPASRPDRLTDAWLWLTALPTSVLLAAFVVVIELAVGPDNSLPAWARAPLFVAGPVLMVAFAKSAARPLTVGRLAVLVLWLVLFLVVLAVTSPGTAGAWSLVAMSCGVAGLPYAVRTYRRRMFRTAELYGRTVR